MEQALTLIQLNNLVRQSIEVCMPDSYWIQAELSEVRTNSNGHCYLEFIEKSGVGNNIIAKAKGTIWSSTYRLLKRKFEESTNQILSSGLKVLVKVSISFHELYGYSLNVTDIDPTFTMGEMAIRRQEILKQLEEEGILNLNKELSLPMLPIRIAVISSYTAAGYDDFCHQLYNNKYGIQFNVTLFSASMQGSQAEATILKALERINDEYHNYDVVVIIRGGGATSDLNCFDTYLLAAACAQMSLPIISGIGHERDYTVIDYVANTRAKTPTAAAEIILDRVCYAMTKLYSLKEQMAKSVANRMFVESTRIERFKIQIPSLVINKIGGYTNMVERLKDTLYSKVTQTIQASKYDIKLLSQRLNDISPERQLRRGYTITAIDGKIIMPHTKVKVGDRLETISYGKRMISDVVEVTDNKENK